MNLFVVDPGTRTGVAWGKVVTQGRSLRDSLCEAEIRSHTVEGGWLEQAQEIETILFDFYLSTSGKKIHIVVEDFILRKMTSDRELLDPVRVTSGFLALVAYQGEYTGGYDVTYQQPSAMASITSDRLRLWNLWIRGSDPALEHQRDARRHFAAYVAEQVKRGG